MNPETPIAKRPSPAPLDATPSTRLALALLAGSAAAYALAVIAASADPGPRAWGLHLPGFLPPPLRGALFAILGAGVAAIGVAALRPSTRSAPSPPRSDAGKRPRGRAAGRQAQSRTRAGRRGPGWLLVLPLYGLLAYWLRERTHFLGDSILWINTLLGAEWSPFNEPLAAAAWIGFRSLILALGLPVQTSVLALLPVLCGVAAAALAWGIVTETIEEARLRAIAWALFLTAGLCQIYFGHIESYPIASVTLLGTLWLALRHARGADPPWLAGVALGLSVATHLIALGLVPSYVVAVLRRRGSLGWKAALLAIPFLVAPVLMLLAGSRPAAWLEPFRNLARSAPAGTSGYLARPYGSLSLEHLVDVVNAFLLAMPALALLLLAWTVARHGRLWPAAPGKQVLAAAALSGAAAAAILVPPVAPAQDWDLSAMFLLPVGVAAIVAGRGLYRDRRVAVGLLALSAASLIAFASVNASESASVRRFKVLIGPDAPLSDYGRGYAASLLSEHYEDRGEQDSARVFADIALRAEPTNPRYWLRVGTILYHQGRFEEAIPKLREAVRRGPTRSETRYNLGLCYARLGRSAEAAAEFAAAVESDGSRPEYRHNLGLMLYESGRVDSARAVWTEVLRRWPGFPLTERSMAKRFGAAAASP